MFLDNWMTRKLSGMNQVPPIITENQMASNKGNGIIFAHRLTLCYNFINLPWVLSSSNMRASSSRWIPGAVSWKMEQFLSAGE